MKNDSAELKKNSKKKIKLSAVIIAKNEEEKIGDAINSVKWADEVVLVDTGSTDKTKDIAKRNGVRVVEMNYGSYNDWRNEGLAKAKGEWILYVDADERVTPLLRDEIIQLTNKQINESHAYAIPRINNILGKDMLHGGWWPDFVKRLFVKEKLKRWKGVLHEEPEIEGEFGHLKNPFIHIKHNNISDMVEKTNIWSQVEAKLMFDANHPPMNVVRFLSAMFREFWLRMIKHKAFLDGSEGIIYAIYQVYSKFISYAKLWEMQISNDPNLKRNNPNDPNQEMSNPV